MKEILLAVITGLVFACSADAQIKKGSIFLGGDVGGYTQKTKYENGTTLGSKGFNISPVAGKFIKDNLVSCGRQS